MSFRIEEKLFIDNENLQDFIIFLKKKKSKKIYESRIIRSLYFDNISFGIYNDSIEGLVPRKKIRVRNYPENKNYEYYLEKKTSSVEGRFKSRELITQEKFIELKNTGIYDNQYGLCLPNIIVEYNREYLIIEDIRFTIDKNIKYISFLNNFQCSEKRIIVELKCDYNKNIDEIVREFYFQRLRFSKYCNAIEALNLK